MPRCDTEAMNLHLAEIAMQIAPGAHAAILLDQADGISPAGSTFRSTSRSSRCPPNVPN
jgi:hypothetical protein